MEGTGKATGASEKDVAQERGCYTREAEGTAEADVQCQSLPSGRLSGGWLAELREIPRSRHEQGHQWPAASARHESGIRFFTLSAASVNIHAPRIDEYFFFHSAKLPSRQQLTRSRIWPAWRART
jgi:hypothetical protein